MNHKKSPHRIRFRAKTSRAVFLLLAFSLVLTAFAVGTDKAVAAEERGRLYALCVGLKYPGTRDSLRFTTDDVRKVAEALRTSSGYDAEQLRVEMLVDDDPRRGKPTLVEIRRLLADLVYEAGENDRLIFYFSGHGILDGDNRSILVCSGGADLQDEKSHLLLSEVKEALARSRARDKLTIIDACHSGGKSAADGSLTPESVAAAMGDAPGVKGAGDPVAWLVSCGQNEKSWEDDDSGHGLFTRYFLDAVGESADLVDSDRDGRLSVREIHDYVSKSIAAYILDKNRNRDAKWRGIRQTPQLGLGGVRDPDQQALRRLNLFYYTEPFTIQETPSSPATFVISPAIEEESAESLFQQGLVFYEGKDGVPHYDEAVRLFRRAADQGDVRAQHYLGMCYKNGWGVALDYREAFSWFQKAANRNLTEALFEVGFLFNNGFGVPTDNLRAFDNYFQAGEQGDARALYMIGELYWNGWGMAKDREKAREVYAEAAGRGAILSFQEHAQKGDCWSQALLGDIYSHDKMISPDYGRALFWYRKAAEQGLSYAQNSLGLCYANGRGVPKDATEAVRWYRKASEQGDIAALYNLASYYYGGNGGLSKDIQKAVELYRKAADGGHQWAQNALGNCYYNGEGVPQSYEEAVKWYRASADNGHVEAQYNLGNCFYNGYGVNQDFSNAAKWYRMAADQGHTAAQFDLGYCYRYGRGVEQDYSEAVMLYRKVAEQGVADAQNILGVCYDDGEGVVQNREEAVKWYRKAVALGHRLAHYNLGLSYYYGAGVTQDRTEAKRLLQIAADKGDKEAIKFLKENY